MLANGAKIYYGTPSGTTSGSSSISYTEIPDLKTLPDLGIEPELVDNTALSDSVRYNEFGIGDPGSWDFGFRYDNSGSTASYRMAKSLDGTKKAWKVELYDGTTFTFEAVPHTRVTGGGVNDPIEFVMSLALRSGITVTDPA